MNTTRRKVIHGLASPRREGRFVYDRLAPGPPAAHFDDALVLARGERP